jgi:hypothetical protein
LPKAGLLQVQVNDASEISHFLDRPLHGLLHSFWPIATASANRAMVFFSSASRASGVACAITSHSSLEKPTARATDLLAESPCAPDRTATPHRTDNQRRNPHWRAIAMPISSKVMPKHLHGGHVLIA